VAKMVKKQLIMEKALELFAKQGFEATSVQQITTHCGISKGSFYLSFKSKDELIIALIDYFLMQITSDVDYKVKNTSAGEELLYKFFFSTFTSLQKHTNFAKILLKEPTQRFNEELLLKFKEYDHLIEQVILSMVERIYGNEINETKYDLIFCIKGFLKIYSELFLFHDFTIDLHLLTQSLVEKTNILATHTTVAFISPEIFQMYDQPLNEEIRKHHILDILDKIIDEFEDSIEKESLQLLKQELIEPSLSRAIVKGLLENIRERNECKLVSYLLRRYYEIES